MPATCGEKITVIFINNAIYGMTGGQMAPTSACRTIGYQTSPYVETSMPQASIRVLKVDEEARFCVAYIERVTVDAPTCARGQNRKASSITEGVGYTFALKWCRPVPPTGA